MKRHCRPLVEIVVSLPYRSRYSFSPPISPSLFRHLGALGLDALAGKSARREFKSFDTKEKGRDFKYPLENIVVSAVYAVAPVRHSLFSPLSPSLHLAPRAVGLQARAFCFANGASSSNLPVKTKKDTDWCPFVLAEKERFELSIV